MRPKKIAVCTGWDTPFMWTAPAFYLMNLSRPAGIAVKVFPGLGPDSARRHMWGIEKALEWEATHISFLGADQLNPIDILEKFCIHIEDGWDVVTAAVPVRGRLPGIKKPFTRIAWKWKDPSKPKPRELCDMRDLEEIDSADGPHQEACLVGTGAMMFDVKLLQDMKKPWFVEAPPDNNAKRIASMDTTFVWRLLTEAKGKMLCDLTIDVKHLEVFPTDETYADKFDDWTNALREEAFCGYLESVKKLPDDGGQKFHGRFKMEMVRCEKCGAMYPSQLECGVCKYNKQTSEKSDEDSP